MANIQKYGGKKEWVTPVPKGKPNQTLKTLKDVRKIASTSDYSKIFESFLLEIILEDISDKLNKTQYGGRKGVGTEHLMVSMIDRIRKVLDNPESVSAVLNSYDWSGAFDRLDPTKVAIKCVKIGIRSSVVSVLIDFMNERVMEVKMNSHTSQAHDLIGGGPQGSILGQFLYIIGSDDTAEEVPEQDKFKYVDDLGVLELIETKEKLIEYDFTQHVPSDVAVGERFLPPETFKSQGITNDLVSWTKENRMKLNALKSKYMIISRSKEKFSTRLTMDGSTLERAQEMIHLGVWLTEDLTWGKHIREICKKSYPR